MSFYHQLNAEDAHRAANRLEAAAKSANDAADRLEEAVRQMRTLTDSGYGNNVERFIEAAQSLQFIEPQTRTTT